MTLLHKHGKALADLVLEWRETSDPTWKHRLYWKMSAMKRAIIALVRKEIADTV